MTEPVVGMKYDSAFSPLVSLINAILDLGATEGALGVPSESPLGSVIEGNEGSEGSGNSGNAGMRLEPAKDWIKEKPKPTVPTPRNPCRNSKAIYSKYM